MTKFSLYYALERDSGKPVCISIEDASKMPMLQAQAKKDMYDASFASKYSAVILASNYGVKNQYKVPFQELPKKASRKKA